MTSVAIGCQAVDHRANATSTAVWQQVATKSGSHPLPSGGSQGKRFQYHRLATGGYEEGYHRLATGGYEEVDKTT